jgi:hypothetical protein
MRTSAIRPTGLRLFWDIWRAGRASPAALIARRRARLADLVTFARAHSPYYRRLYQDLPAHVEDMRRLPPVTKGELMAHFDDWVTDPAVTRADVEGFIADPARVGQRYRRRYHAGKGRDGGRARQARRFSDPGRRRHHQDTDVSDRSPLAADLVVVARCA